MNIVDKLNADLNEASTSLSRISAFSTRDKIVVFLMILVPVAINNVLYWFLQDLLLTQLAVVIFGYIITPMVLKAVINKDVYLLLEARDTVSGSRVALGFIWIALAIGIPVLFLIIGLWFDLIGIHVVTVLGPYFAKSLWNYLYVILASAVFCLIHPYMEGRFYYGVIDAILPSNVIGRIILAILLTSNYISFSFAVVGTNYAVAIALAIFFATYFVLSYISLHRGVRAAIFFQMAVSIISWVLFILFTILKINGSYKKGDSLVYINPRNVFN